MEFVHQLGTSIVACAFARRHLPLTGCTITFGLHDGQLTSSMSFLYWLLPAHKGHTTLDVAFRDHLWHAHNGRKHNQRLIFFRQAMSANDMEYHPRLACILHGVCSSHKQRRPIESSINQCLHASIMECASVRKLFQRPT